MTAAMHEARSIAFEGICRLWRLEINHDIVDYKETWDPHTTGTLWSSTFVFNVGETAESGQGHGGN